MGGRWRRAVESKGGIKAVAAAAAHELKKDDAAIKNISSRVNRLYEESDVGERILRARSGYALTPTANARYRRREESEIMKLAAAKAAEAKLDKKTADLVTEQFKWDKACRQYKASLDAQACIEFEKKKAAACSAEEIEKILNGDAPLFQWMKREGDAAVADFEELVSVAMRLAKGGEDDEFNDEDLAMARTDLWAYFAPTMADKPPDHARLRTLRIASMNEWQERSKVAAAICASLKTAVDAGFTTVAETRGVVDELKTKAVAARAAATAETEARRAAFLATAATKPVRKLSDFFQDVMNCSKLGRVQLYHDGPRTSSDTVRLMLDAHTRNYAEWAADPRGKTLNTADEEYGHPGFKFCFTWSTSASKPVMLVKKEEKDSTVYWEHDSYYAKCTYEDFMVLYDSVGAQPNKSSMTADVSHAARADLLS